MGKTFPQWLANNYPDKTNEFKYYHHLLPDGKEVDARQYKNNILPLFIEYIENDWLYNRAKNYFEPRDPIALNYLPNIIEGKVETKKLTSFDKQLKGMLNVPPEE